MAAQGCHIALLLLLGLLLGPLSASAQDASGRCADAVQQALAPLGDDATGRLLAVQCPTPRVLVLEMDPPGAPTLRVEARVGEPGFVSGGRFGLSPVVNEDWSGVPAPWQAGLDFLAGAFEARGGDLLRAMSSLPTHTPPGFLPELAPEAPPPPQTPWLPLAVALSAGLALVFGRTKVRRRHLALAVVLFVSALTLRLTLGIWGPVHPNGQGPMWLLSAWGQPELLAAYGPGYPQLFTWLARAFPGAPDHAIFVGNALLGALVAPLGASLVLVLGGGVARASLAGALLASDPSALLFSTSESYYPSILCGLLLGATGFSAADRCDLPREARLFGGFAAALALCQIARTHPLAWPLLAVVPATLLARDRRLSRSLLAVLGAVVATVSALALSGPQLLEVAEGVLTRSDLLRPGEAVTAPGAGFWVAAFLWVTVGRRRGRASFAVALAVLPFVVVHSATRLVFLESPVWSGMYRSASLSLPIVLCLLLVPPPRWRWLPPALGLALLVSGLGPLLQRSTEQLEYAFLRDPMRRLGEGARVAYVQRAGLRVMTLPEHLVPGWACGTTSGLSVIRAGDLVKGYDPGESRYYVRTSLCATPEGAPRCDEVERGAPLTELTSITLPAHYTMKSLPYSQDTVTITLYSVTPR